MPQHQYFDPDYEPDFDEWETCPDCAGEGMNGHDCGEDTCCCRYPEENMPCQTCDGAGGWKPKPIGEITTARLKET